MTAQDTAGLVERLRRTPDRNALTQNTCQAQNSLLREAADEIERLSALESRPVALADASPNDTAKDSELAEARAEIERLRDVEAESEAMAQTIGKLGEDLADKRALVHKLADHGTLQALRDANDRSESTERTLSEAQARIRELEGALRPFVAEFEDRRDAYIRRHPRNPGVGAANFDAMPNEWKMENSTFTMGQYRRARTVLSREKEASDEAQ